MLRFLSHQSREPSRCRGRHVARSSAGFGRRRRLREETKQRRLIAARGGCRERRLDAPLAALAGAALSLGRRSGRGGQEG